MPHDKYYLKDKDFERKHNFSLADIFNIEHTSNYLEEYKFYVSEHVSPSKDEIDELIESANGTLQDNYKKNKDSLIVICDKVYDRDLIKTLKSKGVKVYNVDLILDSVFQQELELHKNKYKL